MAHDWPSWITKMGKRLRRGEHLPVPSWLPHPSVAGFTMSALAEPHGQGRDWSMRMADGSRVQVHEFPDGRLEAHGDPADPARSSGRGLWHWLFESNSGGIALATGAVVAIAWAVGRGKKKRRRKPSVTGAVMTG